VAIDLPAVAGARIRSGAPRPALAFLAVGAVLIGVYFLLPRDAQDAVYFAIGAAAVAAVLVGSFRYVQRDRVAWWLFAAGLGALVAGDAVFS
jgi:hypothetical protein